MGRGVRIFNLYWLKMTGKDPNDESKEYWNQLQLEPLKKDRMKAYCSALFASKNFIREGYWAIYRTGILVLIKQRRERFKKEKERRAKENKAAMKVISSAAAQRKK